MIKKAISIIFIATTLFLIFAFPTSASASEKAEIMPLYNNTASATSTASISSSGKITIFNEYYGLKGTTTKATITTYIEKKVLGLFWSRVDIGTANNKWVDVVYNYYYSGTHSYQLKSTGSYRVTVIYEIEGNGGTTDKITAEINKKY